MWQPSTNTQRSTAARYPTPSPTICICLCSSGVVEAHRFAHVAHRLVGEVGSLLASILDDVADQRRVLLVLRRALADRLDLGVHRLDDRLLAFEAPYAGRAAALQHPFLGGGVRIDLVQVPDGALGRLAGVAAPDAGRIRLHRADLLRHLLRRFPEQDGVIVALRHLLSIEAEQLGRLGEQRLGLGEDYPPAAFEEAVEPPLVAERQVLDIGHQLARLLERGGVALLLETRAQRAVELCLLRTHLLDRSLGLLLETLLAPEEVVEAARDLAHE